jgi:hypothetical protein
LSRQDWLPAKPPPSAYPSKWSPSPMTKGCVLTNEGPEIPLRQSSGISVRRRSLSFSERSVRASDHAPSEISKGSNRILNDEQPSGLGVGQGGSLSLEISRRKSFKETHISPQSHSKQFEKILSKPKGEQMASKPLPPSPSDRPRPVTKQVDSQGLETGTPGGQNETAAIKNGQQMPATKPSRWTKWKANLR